MKYKYLKVASIFEYIFTGIYAIITALFYSVSDNSYWLFLALMFVSLALGLYSETIKNHLEKENKLNCKDKIAMYIITVISVIDVFALLFNILTLTSTSESKTIVVLNEEYKEKEKVEKPWYKKSCVIVAIVAFVTIIASSVSGHLFETSSGSVKVWDGTITKVESDKYNKGQPLNGVSYTIDDPTVSISYSVYKPNNVDW